MRQIIALWLAALMLAAQPGQAAVCVGFGQSAPAGVTCSGDWSSGQYESFENSTSATCTTDWTETDTGGVISLKDTDWYNCGTASLEIVGNSGTAALCKVQWDIGAEDTSFTIRAYFSTGTFAATYANFDFLYLFNDALSSQLTMRVRRNDATYRLYAAEGTEYWTITANTKYYFVITYNGGGTTDIKLYNSTGEEQTTSLSDQTVSISTADGARYVEFRDVYGDATSATINVDDIIYSSAAADLSGGQTCN